MGGRVMIKLELYMKSSPQLIAWVVIRIQAFTSTIESSNSDHNPSLPPTWLSLIHKRRQLHTSLLSFALRWSISMSSGLVCISKKPPLLNPGVRKLGLVILPSSYWILFLIDSSSPTVDGISSWWKTKYDHSEIQTDKFHCLYWVS